jgi:hypothetical protein
VTRHLGLWLVAGITLTGSIVHAQPKPCPPKTHAKLPVVTDMTYHAARKALLANRWQPLQTKSPNTAQDDPDIAYGNGQVFWSRGYREIESCSGTGVAACAFLFKDAYGNRLRVTTAGMEVPKQKEFASVSSYQFVCD